MKTASLYAFAFLFLLGCNGNQQNDIPEKLELTGEVTLQNEVALEWGASENDGFESYELYRHSASGINRETGELIHVGANSSATDFTDVDVQAGTTYFYRLYHLLTSGSSTGSEILEITTNTHPIISNGDFELAAGTVENWTLEANSFGDSNNYAIVSNDNPYDGTNCIEFFHNSPTGCWEQWATQKIDLDLLTAERKYKVQFYYRADYNFKSASIILRNNELDIWNSTNVNYAANSGWKAFESEITLPSDIGSTDPSFTIHFCEQGVHKIWIDQVSMTPM